MSNDTPGSVPRLPDLSVVIPCFNEAARIERLSEGLDQLVSAGSGLRLQVVLVDDGSGDDTASRLRQVAERLRGRPGVLDTQVVSLPANRGKGAALQAGVAVTRGRWLLTADADMATPLTEALRWQRDGRTDLHEPPPRAVFLASREHDESLVEDSGPRRMMGRVFNLLVQTFTGLRLTDTQCGFKLYPGDAGRALFADLCTPGWSHDIELLMAAERRGLQLVDLPVRWQAISDSRVRPLRDAVRMSAALAAIRARIGWREDLGMGRGGVGSGFGWQRATVLLYAALTIVVLATFRDYGITWDEELHRAHGKLVFDYWKTLPFGEPDRHVMGLSNVFLYGGVFDLAGYLASQALPLSEFESRHLVNALVGLLGMVAAGRLANLLWGARGGFFAAAALALTPTYWGHMFANPKDVPFAAAFAWGLYYLVRWLRELPAPSRGTVLKCALALGLAAGIRVGGLLLLCYLTMAAGLWLVRWAPPGSSGWRRAWLRVAGSATAVLVGGWVTMLLCWPFAFEQPVAGPLIALRAFSQFDFRGAVLFGGRVLSLPETPLPWSYVPWLAAIQLPLLLLAALLVAAVALLLALSRASTRWQLTTGATSLLWFALLFPAAHVIVTGAVLYDNLRQLTFLLPIAAVLAAYGIETAWRLAGTGPARLMLVVLLAAQAAGLVRAYVQLHPYQYVYYNALVGGVAGAAGDYETDYWAAAYREAAMRLNEHARDAAYSRERPLRVWVSGPSWCAREYFDERIEWVGGPRSADVILTTTRTRSHRSYEGPEVLRVERPGVVLAYVFEASASQ